MKNKLFAFLFLTVGCASEAGLPTGDEPQAGSVAVNAQALTLMTLTDALKPLSVTWNYGTCNSITPPGPGYHIKTSRQLYVGSTATGTRTAVPRVCHFGYPENAYQDFTRRLSGKYVSAVGVDLYNVQVQ